MRAALKSVGARLPTARQASIPAPVGGWNRSKSIADMPETDAYDMANFYPENSRVDLRRGYSSWATGLGGTVESIMEYASPTARKLFGAANGAFYEATAGGAVGAAVDSGHTNNRWQHTMFATSAGSFLVAVNGADDPRNYDGTTWNTTPAITGVTGGATTLIGVHAHKARLWFTQTGTLVAWYLGTSAIGGAATAFDIAPFADMGGYLVGTFTWTVDGGTGQNDLLVFLTSQGQAIIYSGITPGSDFVLQGVYNIGRPIGRRCAMKYGGDLLVVTEDGYIPLSQVLPSTRGRSKQAYSMKITDAVKEVTRSYKSNFGWEPLLYPKQGYLLINVPYGNGVFVQHVMNTDTGSWTRFENQNASCWTLFNDELYFGAAGGIIYKADTGTSDAGANINGFVTPAFSYFNSHGRQKRFTAMRPIFSSSVDVQAKITFNTDLELRVAANAGSSNFAGAVALWDSAVWDAAFWVSDQNILKNWLSIAAIGFSGTPSIAVATMTGTISLLSIDYVYEIGGIY